MIRRLSNRLITLAAISASVLLLLAQPGPASAQVPFERVKQGSGSSFRIEPKTWVLTSQGDLQEAWTFLGRHDQPPAVDFQQHSAILHFGGMKASGGYSEDVERVQIRAGVMQVHVVESVPGGSCGTSQTATFPFVLIQTIPWKGSIEPLVRTVVHECN